MGHHFDSPEARADSRINISDNYLFHSPADPRRVVAVMCVSPLAGLPSPYHGRPQWRTFRPGTAYELCFDTDGDIRADRVLRLVFSGDRAPQRFEAFWLDDGAARDEAAAGESAGSGTVEAAARLTREATIWTGEAGDAFWLDAVAAKQFLDAMLAGGRFEPQAFSKGTVTTAATNVLAIVVELPISAIGGERWNFWSRVAANDHGHWHAVARCGRPNFAATFVDDPRRSRLMNESEPAEDRVNFSGDVTRVVERLVTAAGTAAEPRSYAQRVARWLLPDVIPFDPAIPTGFDFAGLNGRALTDDFGSVVYSVVYNYPMRSSLPRVADLRAGFPYLPPPRPLPVGPAVSVPDRNG